MGVCLYYSSTRLPQIHVILETAVVLPLGIFLIMIDPARETWAVPGVKMRGENTNNLLAWFVWGCAMQLTSVVLLTRHYMVLGITSRMKKSFYRVSHEVGLYSMDALIKLTSVANLPVWQARCLDEIDALIKLTSVASSHG